ncbi:IS5 family transposase [Deinococcus aluminii]|uniref:IS5 family transposase ISMac15 n=1 Tax=Deinococcus aluminii TaxID=1656885 RepID=A0ABP9XBT9_9DEIO
MRRRRYTSDLTRKQFKRIEALLPACKAGGRPRKVDLYEVICAILYVLQNGCTWRDLPHDLPAWQTVYGYFRRFQREGIWEAVNRFLVRRTRKKAGRNPEPSAAIMDAQTVRCSPQAGPRGVDAGKRTNGRKRHLLVDTLGLLLVVWVTTGSVQDRDGGPTLLSYARRRFRRLRLVWADGGYAGKLVEWVTTRLGWTLEIVKREPEQRGFVVLKRRWVVERSLAWATRCRRRTRDYEGLPNTTEAWFYLANIRLMLRRLEP